MDSSLSFSLLDDVLGSLGLIVEEQVNQIKECLERDEVMEKLLGRNFKKGKTFKRFTQQKMQ